ncbi:MAG TPA: chorismate-binding protein [Solirubrobacteraceae bacterium]|nr:chorismate-binding protein [Solirubrobacteraceae bacterium]
MALDGRADAATVLRRLSGERLPFALTGRWTGGGAILGSEPLAVAGPHADPFATLDALPALAPDSAGPGGPAIVGGGWFGWLGYRLGARIERLPAGPPRPVVMPEHHLAYYDHVLRRDPDGRWWFEALATPRREPELRARLAHLRAVVAGRGEPHAPATPVPPLTLAPAAAAHHLDAVADGVRRIAAGEIFQANLCLSLRSETTASATELYAAALARADPAYGAAFATPAGGVASLSPELFLRRRGRDVVSAPIKGTLPRPPGAPAAAAALARLRASAKDAAEHVMIVDLMRNDLGRVCTYGSVHATPVPEAEAHPGLWHLVSRVQGRLRPGVGDGELLRATFPPGSVTGAPKVQAMHVIAALEATAREVYTGAIGYASPLAGLELNVAIRTLELHDGAMWLGAGGGIVADSDPRAELEEALAKARPVAAALGTTVVAPPVPARALAGVR